MGIFPFEDIYCTCVCQNDIALILAFYMDIRPLFCVLSMIYFFFLPGCLLHKLILNEPKGTIL